MRRPVIGIPSQTLEETPDRVPGGWMVGQRYVRPLVEAGAVPWVIPLVPAGDPTLREIYDRLDGIFLPGGVDIDPGSYREERAPGCGRTDPARDAVELALAGWAMADRRPLLAVCRGLQLLNVAAGGTLHQHLEASDSSGSAIPHDHFEPGQRYAKSLIAHPVSIAPGSRLRAILGADQVEVNSLHHQAIRELAPGLVASAHAPDGVIEGIEMPGDRFTLGVQWHPEVMTEHDERMRRLFRAFVEEAAAHAARGAGGLTSGAGPR